MQHGPRAFFMPHGGLWLWLLWLWLPWLNQTVREIVGLASNTLAFSAMDWALPIDCWKVWFWHVSFRKLAPCCMPARFCLGRPLFSQLSPITSDTLILIPNWQLPSGLIYLVARLRVSSTLSTVWSLYPRPLSSLCWSTHSCAEWGCSYDATLLFVPWPP